MHWTCGPWGPCGAWGLGQIVAQPCMEATSQSYILKQAKGVRNWGKNLFVFLMPSFIFVFLCCIWAGDLSHQYNKKKQHIDFFILQNKILNVSCWLRFLSLLWTFALWLQGLISQDAAMCKGHSCPPQIFILLQYQTLAHRIKATVLRADNLDNLVDTLAAAGKEMSLQLKNCVFH